MIHSRPLPVPPRGASSPLRLRDGQERRDIQVDEIVFWSGELVDKRKERVF